MTETELPTRVVNASGVLEGTVDHEKVIACNVDSHKCQREEEQSACSIKDEALLSSNLNENVYEAPDEDPREKAMTYLEESGTIRMFQVCWLRHHVFQDQFFEVYFIAVC